MEKQDKRSIVKNIYESTKKAILLNNLKRGDRLVESKIATDYDVNRIYVKEALQLLVAENLAEYIPRKGFVVIGLDINDIYEISKLREALENIVLENFIINASDDDIKQVVDSLQKKLIFLQNSYTDFAVSETKNMFNYIYGQSSFKRIVSMLELYSDYIDVIIKTSIDTPENIKKSIENTINFSNAFTNRDIDLVKKCLEIRHNNLNENLRKRKS